MVAEFALDPATVKVSPGCSKNLYEVKLPSDILSFFPAKETGNSVLPPVTVVPATSMSTMLSVVLMSV